MILDALRVPVVLAPLAGGPSTPPLAAAVTESGGLGFLASGYLSAAETEARIEATRRLTDGLIGVNVFAPGEGASDPATYAGYLERLARWASSVGAELGDPRYSDDDWEAKLALLVREPVAVVSFTFGCPSPKTIASLQAAGSEVWVTVTSPEEAREAGAAGADVLVVQGAEAGGHRGSFHDTPALPVIALLPLIGLVRAVTGLPLVASGGVATREGLAAVLSAGARAAQIGTAFMLAPEAGTSAAHRRALRSHTPTVLTRAFTGRLARGIENGFTAAHSNDAPVAYPELHYVTAPLRKRARETGDAELINLWAGEAHALALELPAAEIVARLTGSGQTADSAQVFNLAATDYDAARRRLVPPFDAFYGTAVEAVRLAGEPQRILDLGAGTGRLSTLLRDAFPAAHVTLLDGAPQMLAQARATLGDRDVRYLEADLRDPLPDGPWDAVVSALAIHHLDDADKQALMRRVHGALRPDGVFVNAEQVDGPSPFFTNLYAAWHELRARAAGSDDAEWSAALERMRQDHCASVEDQIGWLHDAGFRAADCLFKQYRFAVIVALP